MSALRKLRQLKLNGSTNTPIEPVAETDQEPISAKGTTAVPDLVEKDTNRSNVNAFDMLLDDDDDGDGDEEDDIASSPLGVSEKAAPLDSTPTESTNRDEDNTDHHHANDEKASAPASLSNKSAARPKKSKAKKSNAGASVKASPQPNTTEEKEDWEIEFAPAASSSTLNPSSSPTASSSSSSHSSDPTSVWNFLQTDPRQLDPSIEIRSIFGSRMDRDTAAEGGGGGGHHPPGHNHAGFRRGGAGQRRMVGGGISQRASASSKRLFVRPQPDWPRTEERGLLKMQYVATESEPKKPNTTKTTSSGMHGNIHSLATSTSSSSSSTESSDESMRAAEAAYKEALARYESQQLLALTPGVMEYTFVHTSDFHRLQQDYLSVAGSQDVQQLLYFVRSHPFHPDAALTMSEIFAAQSQFGESHKFIQCAIHVFENAFTPTFIQAVKEGRARMDGNRNENQPFFTALARHAQTLGKKGCTRTAFEIVKLLLSLSPLHDPMGMLFAIDYYALRSKQYAFLQDFARQLDQAIMSAYRIGAHPWSALANSKAATSTSSSSSLSPSPSSSSTSATSGWSQPVPRAPATFLPNLMYSRALAAFHMEFDAASGASGNEKGKKKSSSSSSSSSSYAAAAASIHLNADTVVPPSLPTSAGGHSMLEEYDSIQSTSTSSSSSYLIQQALLMWPSLLKPLLEGAGQESAAGRAPWTNIISTLQSLYEGSFLTSSSSHAPSTPYLAKLELIYVERCASLWKSDRVIAWLLTNAKALAQAIDEKRYTTEMITKFRDARMKYLLGLPFPYVVKSLQKSAYSDHVPSLPPELLMAQHAFDADAERLRAQQQHRAAQMDEAGMRPLNLAQHPMRVFLESLLPWFVAPNGEGDMVGNEADLDAAVARVEALPPNEREAVLRGLLEQAAGGGVIEDEIEAGLEADLQAEIANNTEGIDYGDYQFDEDNEEDQEDQQNNRNSSQ